MNGLQAWIWIKVAVILSALKNQIVDSNFSVNFIWRKPKLDYLFSAEDCESRGGSSGGSCGGGYGICCTCKKHSNFHYTYKQFFS